jgi:hypothetical protein
MFINNFTFHLYFSLLLLNFAHFSRFLFLKKSHDLLVTLLSFIFVDPSIFDQAIELSILCFLFPEVSHFYVGAYFVINSLVKFCLSVDFERNFFFE